MPFSGNGCRSYRLKHVFGAKRETTESRTGKGSSAISRHVKVAKHGGFRGSFRTFVHLLPKIFRRPEFNPLQKFPEV